MAALSVPLLIAPNKLSALTLITLLNATLISSCCATFHDHFSLLITLITYNALSSHIMHLSVWRLMFSLDCTYCLLAQYTKGHVSKIYCLHHFLAPRIQGELDELEREEFFRLKKVQKNKQKVIAAQDAEKLALKEGQVCASVRIYALVLGIGLSRTASRMSSQHKMQWWCRKRGTGCTVFTRIILKHGTSWLSLLVYCIYQGCSVRLLGARVQ